MGSMLIENNTFHDNYLYGIDPHTGTHDMIIRNNKVHHNNASAIICSKHCYDILIEGNEIYNNGKAQRGIAFSINTTNSIARNNYIHDQISCIGANRGSDYNKIYNNTISNCKIGINLADTSHQVINENKISGVEDAIILRDTLNKIFHNKIQNSTNAIVLINASESNQIVTIDNKDKKEDIYTDFLTDVSKVNEILDVRNPSIIISGRLISEYQFEKSEYENITDVFEEIELE